jgi:hypothetical protein
MGIKTYTLWALSPVLRMRVTFPPKTEEPFFAQVFEEELKEFERETGSR